MDPLCKGLWVGFQPSARARGEWGMLLVFVSTLGRRQRLPGGSPTRGIFGLQYQHLSFLTSTFLRIHLNGGLHLRFEHRTSPLSCQMHIEVKDLGGSDKLQWPTQLQCHIGPYVLVPNGEGMEWLCCDKYLFIRFLDGLSACLHLRLKGFGPFSANYSKGTCVLQGFVK